MEPTVPMADMSPTARPSFRAGAVLLVAAPFAWIFLPEQLSFHTMNVFAMMPAFLLVPTVVAAAFYPRS